MDDELIKEGPWAGYTRTEKWNTVGLVLGIPALIIFVLVAALC